MAKRMEIALKDHLFDPEGAGLCRRIGDYFGWHVGAVRVIQILTLDTRLSEQDLDAIRKEVFTNPITQVSAYDSLAKDFDWAVWIRREVWPSKPSRILWADHLATVKRRIRRSFSCCGMLRWIAVR